MTAKDSLGYPEELSNTDIEEAWKKFEGGRVVIEECISLDTELSVLVARDSEGKYSSL